MQAMQSILFWLLFTALFIGWMVVVQAEENRLLPTIPQAHPTATQCVEPTEVMRRQHMDFILHQRDETVHKGIRTERHQLVGCINCHIQPDEKGTYPRHTDSRHFCTTCHEYSSVKIDCFSCHADRPESVYRSGGQDGQ